MLNCTSFVHCAKEGREGEREEGREGERKENV